LQGNVRTDGDCGGSATILSYIGKAKQLSGAEHNNKSHNFLPVISGLKALTKECSVMVDHDSEYMRDGIAK
jgi:ribonuclease HI